MRNEDGLGQGRGYPATPHLHPALHAVSAPALRSALQRPAPPTADQQGITPPSDTPNTPTTIFFLSSLPADCLFFGDAFYGAFHALLLF